jgi:exodeoxyribonuclease V alpha subunit
LKYIFRQDEKSLIVSNAHRVNQGLFPVIDRPMGKDLADFYFIECNTASKVLRTIKELVSERIPSRFGLHPTRDIQVLSAIHKGEVGVENINAELQQLLNPNGRRVSFGTKSFRIADKVMQIRNDYIKEVFNGDMGEVMGVDEDEGTLRVDFQNRVVEYKRGEADQILLAYAASIHKSQGCEYPAVVVPIVTQHYMLLQRNLLYTAITRGRKLVVLVGMKNAINIAINNDRTDKRYTHLEESLRGRPG